LGYTIGLRHTYPFSFFFLLPFLDASIVCSVRYAGRCLRFLEASAG
jgi:hypothetical protein